VNDRRLSSIEFEGIEKISGEVFPIKKAIPVIVVTWILSVASTVAIVYVAPDFLPIKTHQIANSAITSVKIADGAIIATKLADGSVISAKILDGTITAVDMADGSIVTAKIANGAVTSDKVVNGAVTSDKIANGAVTSDKVADGAVVSIKIANGSVTSAKILDGAITSADLSNGSIITTNIADGAVTTAKIADRAVTSDEIVDNAIVTIKLADGSVTSAKILDGTITAADLATSSVSTIKIVDGAVTNVKLESKAIPFDSTYSTDADSTTSTTFKDMLDMSVSITLGRKSHVLILFSCNAYQSLSTASILIRARVGTLDAQPGSVFLLSSNPASNGAYAYNFFLPNVAAGTYTVKIQWSVSSGEGHVGDRTLTVIGLPA